VHRAGVSQPISAGRPIFTHTSSSRLEILAGQEQRAELLDLTLKLKHAVRIDQDINLLHRSQLQWPNAREGSRDAVSLTWPGARSGRIAVAASWASKAAIYRKSKCQCSTLVG
jgi:hypothetical protein